MGFGFFEKILATNFNEIITPALNNRKVFLCLSEAITALLSAKSFSTV